MGEERNQCNHNWETTKSGWFPEDSIRRCCGGRKRVTSIKMKGKIQKCTNCDKEKGLVGNNPPQTEYGGDLQELKDKLN